MFSTATLAGLKSRQPAKPSTRSRGTQTRAFSTARVIRRPGHKTHGLILLGPHRFECALGRRGISRFKREGDGATPAGRLPLLRLMIRRDRIAPPPGRMLARLIRADDGWCDDPSDGRYNRMVRLPFAFSHEILRRDDTLYDVLGILDWNITSRALGRGSAIFFHLAHDDMRPTAGCIAVTKQDMDRILRLIRPNAVFWVV